MAIPASFSTPLDADACIVARNGDAFEPAVASSTHIVLESNEEGKPTYFAIPLDAAKQASGLLRDHIGHDEAAADGDDDAAVIPANTDAWTLSRCCAYMIHHMNNAAAPIDKPMNRPLATYLSVWDQSFLEQELFEKGDEAKHDGLIAVMQAAHFLNIAGLLDLCGAAIAQIMRGKDVDAVRDLFKIEQDQTAEELERIRASNAAFDKTMGLEAPPVAGAGKASSSAPARPAPTDGQLP